VTVLFADIRGFSRISERLGPPRTVEWVRAVMEALSDCVLAHRGVLVNYIGDELMAMWGAPEERSDHAELACRAALAMLDLLAPLNERWQNVLQEPTALGIGLNTGVARVGNTGSQRRVVYGPLGNTVNLASRVRGATKHLRSNLLITGTTQARLGAEFAVRRLAQVRAVNIAERFDLYELVRPGIPGWDGLKKGYEEALRQFSARAFREAIHLLGRLLPRHPNDGPLLVLLSRAVDGLGEEPATFDPVWELPGK
jgi:adenylate cyclase